MHSILEVLTRPDTTIATKDWAHGMLQKILAKLCGNDDDTDSLNSDITEQLKQNELVLREKDNEILELKAELTKKQNQIQQLNSRMQQQQQYYANMFTNGPSVFPNITYPPPSVPP